MTIVSDFRVRIPMVGPLLTRLMLRFSETTWIPAMKKEMEEYAKTHPMKPAA